MSRLIESIKAMNGQYYNLPYHERRMERSLRNVFGARRCVRLAGLLEAAAIPSGGLHKCRVLYDRDSFEIAYAPYQAKRICRIRTVEDDHIRYPYKFEDRRDIDRLFALKGDCDDVLIIKEGKVTDCSFSNIAFRKGSTWVTPADALLRGTMREKLIDEKRIEVQEILKADIPSFDTFKIINAMLEFESPEIEVSAIVF